MPININNMLSAANNTKQFSPKFFTKDLTGKGGKVGVLNASRDPINIGAGITSSQEAYHDKNRKIVNNGYVIHTIPMSAISHNEYQEMETCKCPDVTEMYRLVNIPNEGVLYAHTRMFSAVYREIPSTMKKGSVTKTWEFAYMIRLYLIRDSKNNLCNKVPKFTSGTKRNEYIQLFSANPAKKLANILPLMHKDWVHHVTTKALSQYIDSISAYECAYKEAEHWSVGLHDDIEQLMRHVESVYQNDYVNTGRQSLYPFDSYAKDKLFRILCFLETYNVPLEEYRLVYDTIHDIIDDWADKKLCIDKEKLLSDLCKQNLNLRLSETLNLLNDNKSKLQTYTPDPNKTPISLRRYSPEQVAAITTTEPLVLVQSGAGCGKTTLISGHMGYMTSVGVDPDDITVLSFTNAAADNIKAHNSDVHSMTIASMVNQIYGENFPNQRLCENKTIYNCIDTFFPPTGGRDPFYREFQNHLTYLIHNDSGAYTRINNFVEENYDKVIATLETLGQVSLELQIIICYQKIDEFKEPPTVTSKYLIIDEVQDNSIFEFVYVLKYVTKHLESLFIVGDSSQTLYEFRASNPKALNIMEASGVFKTYKLTTNYRSNQEILDFANTFLNKIEANKYANIQLQANTIARVTHKSFTDKVKFHYEQVAKLTRCREQIPTWLNLYAKAYIDSKLQCNERVTFLAYTRDVIYAIEKWLNETYPGYKIANLIPQKTFTSDVLSKFIAKYWNDVNFMPSQNIATSICQTIERRLVYLIKDADKHRLNVTTMLNKWATGAQADINVWTTQYQRGQITKEEFLSFVQQSMINYEIDNNAIRQSLIAARNEETKRLQNAQSANFVLSTIHSAKGLEFENVVVIYRNENDMNEEKKRMYYVALTRAMQSEFILAYDNVNSPQIQADYKTIVEGLKTKKVSASATSTSTTDPE